MKQQKRILLIGVGSTIRGDDGIGAYICSSIGNMHLPGLTVITAHQADSNLTDDINAADIVIVADAAVEGDGVSFTRIQADDSAGVTSGHYMNAALLLQITKLLHGHEPELYVCSVTGYSFEMAEQLSPAAKKNADKAVGIISMWIRDNS